MEELLQRKRGQIDFQIPIFPGLPVETIMADIAIQEPVTGIATFGLVSDTESDMSSVLTQSFMEMIVAKASSMASNVPANGLSASGVFLPRLLRGYYDPGPLPANGLLLLDSTGTCFVQLFNPPDILLSTAGPLPRNIVFVIDVSGSMLGQKLLDAKEESDAILDK